MFKSKRWFLIVFFYTLAANADPFIRYNQAGYVPDRPKSLIIMSSHDLKGQTWYIKSKDSVILSGTISESIAGTGTHTSHPFNHEIDFSALKTIGDYDFSIGITHAKIHIAADPYSVFITDALRHLKTVRSGSKDALNHGFSHGGDSAAIVYKVKDAPSDGKWIEATPHQTIDMMGGWYDAGDYFKFTLTIANTVYFLLEAYEANPKAFTKVLSGSDLPDVLDEAKFGLSYLLKTHPTNDLFVIQVGNAPDHWQPLRLPEYDALDGKRPALCAISPAHMGITAAVLAKGARIFKSQGKDSIANVYLLKAKEIFSRAQQSDTLESPAYEKGEINDAYLDNASNDNMGIGAVELFKTTCNTSYFNIANTYFPPAQGYFFEWAQYNFPINKTLAPYSTKSKTEAQNEINYYINNMEPVWGIATPYMWGSMIQWNAIGAAAAEWNRIIPDPKAKAFHLKMVDLLFGRNNWGLSFIASPRLPNTIHSCYNPVYTLKRLFPLGAVSLGPGDITTHNRMIKVSGHPPASPLDSFQTSGAVYCDYDRDFMNNETTISSQSFAIWMLALTCDTITQAKADSSIPLIETVQPVIDSILTFVPQHDSWFTSSDSENGGKSVAQWVDTASHTIKLEANVGYKYPNASFGCHVPEKIHDFSNFNAIRLYGNFEENSAFFLAMQMPDVTDSDCHGQFILGKGTSTVQISFSEASQQGWGKYIPFNPSKITDIYLTYGNTIKPAVVRIDSISLIRFSNHQSSSIKQSFRQKPDRNQFWSRKGLQLKWKKSIPAELQIQNLQGRTLFKKMVMPDQEITLPRYKGFQILTFKDELLDKWISF